MKDPRTLAFINLYALLGSLPQLCEISRDARFLLKDQHVDVAFRVNNGPEATLSFQDGVCALRPDIDRCDIRLPFNSPEKFNGMIDGTVTPLPNKGFTKISFLTKKFQPLTDILSHYLQPTEEDLADEDFFNDSTTLMFHMIMSAIAQIANEDPVGRVSASYVSDGTIKMGIAGGPAAALICKDHRFTVVHEAPESYLSEMEFSSMKLARALFDGKVNSVACIGLGQIRVRGLLSQMDNVNRMMDRIPVYLG